MSKKPFTYVIEKKIGVVSTAGTLPVELNLISYNGAAAKYDLRKWKDRDGERSMQKGIALTREELLDLREFLNTMEVV